MERLGARHCGAELPSQTGVDACGERPKRPVVLATGQKPRSLWDAPAGR
jgi:hypothetical protein